MGSSLVDWRASSLLVVFFLASTSGRHRAAGFIFQGPHYAQNQKLKKIVDE
jgi:hypothetical protein